jgi:nucleotide-binding universal stress UspA family protein
MALIDVATAPVVLSPIGIIIGCAYAILIASILWWMLHVPPAGGPEQKAARIIREAGAYARILVPVQGNALSDRMVAFGCQMAKYRDAELTVLYVIEVPPILPLDAAMPDEDRGAAEAFERARKIADRYNVKVNTAVLKTRRAGPGIVQYARDHQYDVILMGHQPSLTGGTTAFTRSVEYVLQHAPSEVIIDRPAMV